MKKLLIILGIVTIAFGLYHFRYTFAYPVISPPVTTIENSAPNFQADLKSTLDLQAGVGKATFTRATIATVTDFEGLIKKVKSGEARFEGARRVENLLTYSEDLSNVAWTKTGTATVTGTNQINFPAVNDTIIGQVTKSVQVGDVYVGSMQLSGSGTVTLRIIRQGVGTSELATVLVTLTSTPTTYYLAKTFSYAQTGVRLDLLHSADSTATVVTATHAQLEDVTGQANQNPSEYVSTNVKTSAPYHGANVDGVKYFTTYNGNTTASNVVTEATGANIPDATLHGYVAEGARTNSLLYSEALNTSSKWVLTGTVSTTTSPAGTQTALTYTEDSNNGIHGFAASSGNRPIFTGSITSSFYLKAGTRRYIWFSQNIGGYLTVDTATMTITEAAGIGGGTYNSSSITNVGNGWYRVQITTTVSSATIVTLIRASNTATSGGTQPSYQGDGVSTFTVWGAQLEAGAFASSYIPTTSASVTRNADVLTYPTGGNVDGTKGTAYAETTESSSYLSKYFINADSLGNMPIIYYSTVGKLSIYDGITESKDLSFTQSTSIIQKVASKWGNSSMKTFSGGISGTGASFDGNINMGTRFGFSVGSPATVEMYGTIRNVKIWKKALTDTQLTNMTSTDNQTSMSAIKKTIIRKTGTTIIKKAF
jgi:hypothetical protein